MRLLPHVVTGTFVHLLPPVSIFFFNDSGYATQNMWQCLKFIQILGSRASSSLVNGGCKSLLAYNTSFVCDLS